jgi:hypothetical protein
MEKDKKLNEAIDRLSQNSDHWQMIKQVLLEDIRANQELITLIDEKIKENEHKIYHLN